MKKVFQDIIDANEGSFLASVALLHPKSRGTIRLKSNNPFDPPLIDPNYLDNPDDLKTLLKGNWIIILIVFLRISRNSTIVIAKI